MRSPILRFPTGGRPNLSGMPEAVRLFFRTGFRVLREEVASDDYEVLVDATLASMSGLDDPEESELAERLSVSPEQVRPLLAASGLLVGSVSVSKSDELDDFLQALVDAKLIEEEQTEPVAKFATELAQQRERLRTNLEQTSLASDLLPSLEDVDVVLDLRVSVKNETVAMHVPIAIIRLETDDYDQKLVFQTTESQLGRLIKHLKASQEKMATMANWADDRG